MIKIAILDMNEQLPNQGMRCIRELVSSWGEQNSLKVIYDEFEVRVKQELPDLSYDAYISSGGPGSPLDSKGSEWENKYFDFITSVLEWNENPANDNKKHIFFICHSYQLACRYFDIAEVSKRKSCSFGIFPMHMLPDGSEEPVFAGLNDPFYAVDSRDYQVIQPDADKLAALGGKVLAIEKERPHRKEYERAVMAVRFNDYFIGTQFHPEADAEGMSMYFKREDKKQNIIENHGVGKWNSMVQQLQDPDKIMWTYKHILPNFLNMAVGELVEA